MSNNKSYLGDGVYVDIDEFVKSIILTTENGISTTNTIYLEDQVVEALVRYLKNKGFVY